jgi:hypothetical protein
MAAMNQEQVKEKLLELESDLEEFSVIFSGKTSKKVHGLYQPDTREIIIHNRNFESDNELMYTAIHEFAHHIHFTKSERPVSNRAHTTEFRSIFHNLLVKAEQLGIYQNQIDSVDELKTIAAEIRQKYIHVNGELMKDFGQALMEAEKLCRKHKARFEDFIERVLQMPKQSAGTLMKIKALDLPSSVGFDNMKTLANIRNSQLRKEALDSLHDGQSPDMVKQALKERPNSREVDPVKKLEQEKKRIEKTLTSLQDRLEQINHELDKVAIN